MIKHVENKTVNYGIEQVFKLVCDVEKYPEFVPFCVDTSVYERKEGSFCADMYIGAGFINEKFTTKASFGIDDSQESAFVDIEYIEGPFKSLKSKWAFKKNDESHTEIEFSIFFELKSGLFQSSMNKMFKEISKKTVAAFEERAKKIYK
jgi:coenzyme Q-binding protein COQ10